MTKRNTYGLYALAFAIVVVGALGLGMPMGALGLVVITLACPLTMFAVMRGMHGGGGMHQGNDTPADRPAGDHPDLLRTSGHFTGSSRQ